MPRRRATTPEPEIELTSEEIEDIFKDRVASNFLRTNYFRLLQQVNEIPQCCICDSQIESISSFLLLTCGHCSTCAGCWQYVSEPKVCPTCRA